MFWAFDGSVEEAFKKARQGRAAPQLCWYLQYTGLHVRHKEASHIMSNHSYAFAWFDYV